jgi:hypothetical protein
MSDLWSVTVPGYATGAGTVLLVIVTAMAIYRDRRRDKAEALREARRVFAAAIERDVPGTAQVPRKFQSIMIVNAGPDPIFDVGAGSYKVEGSRATWMPGVHQSSVPFILPGDRGYLNGHWAEVNQDGSLPHLQLQYWAYPTLPVVVSWTDGRGLRWERLRGRKPHQIDIPLERWQPQAVEPKPGDTS